MLKSLRQLSLKEQLLCFLEFIISYFSPLIALVLFIFMRVKRKDKQYQLIPLCGAGIALFLYIVDYISYLMR